MGCLILARITNSLMKCTFNFTLVDELGSFNCDYLIIWQNSFIHSPITTFTYNPVLCRVLCCVLQLFHSEYGLPSLCCLVDLEKLVASIENLHFVGRISLLSFILILLLFLTAKNAQVTAMSINNVPKPTRA